MNGHLSSCVLNDERPKPGSGSPILVIEDDRELAEEIRLDLEAGGHTVQIAETLTDGLRAALSGDAATLVIDRLLDGENGLSIVEALRGEGKRTPALVLGGLTSFDEQIAGLKAGCYYLDKPFDCSRTDRAGRDPLAPRRRRGRHPAQGGRSGNGLDRPNSQVQRQARSIWFRGNSSCSNILCAVRAKPSLERCCSRTFGISSARPTPTSSTCRSAICAVSSTRLAIGASSFPSGRSASD